MNIDAYESYLGTGTFLYTEEQLLNGADNQASILTFTDSTLASQIQTQASPLGPGQNQILQNQSETDLDIMYPRVNLEGQMDSDNVSKSECDFTRVYPKMEMITLDSDNESQKIVSGIVQTKMNIDAYESYLGTGTFLYTEEQLLNGADNQASILTFTDSTVPSQILTQASPLGPGQNQILQNQSECDFTRVYPKVEMITLDSDNESQIKKEQEGPCPVPVKEEPAELNDESEEMAVLCEEQMESMYIKKKEEEEEDDEERMDEPEFVVVTEESSVEEENHKGSECDLARVYPKMEMDPLDSDNGSEGSTKKTDRQPYMECSTASCLQIASSSSLSSSAEEFLSRTSHTESRSALIQSLYCQTPFEVPSCSVEDDAMGQERATGGSLSGWGEKEQVVAERQRQHNSLSGNERGPGIEATYPNCSICGTRYLLEKHTLVHSSARPDKCRPCQISFHQDCEPTDHTHIHMVQNAFKCNQCDNLFQNSYYLTLHKRTHTGEKPFKCYQCGKSYCQKQSLTRHVRIHTGVKPYECNECGKLYHEKGALIAHSRIHTGHKPYKCHHCEMSFLRKDYLTKHMRTHTGEKPYKCKQCGKLFRQKFALHQHIRTHTGAKPYKCNQCGKSFSYLSSFNCHMRTHTGDKPYKCKQCGRSFSYLTSFNCHLRTHTSERPFRCTLCTKSFRHKCSLNEHMKIHRGSQ